jgi:hypothetical protein
LQCCLKLARKELFVVSLMQLVGDGCAILCNLRVVYKMLYLKSMQETGQPHIEMFRSLFRGREDVFAIRWEKGRKSGYMPAYSYDRFRYRAHKIKGGTLKDFADKRLTPLSDEQIAQHVKGKQHIGLYPLLPDNTSWFIAADFDKGEWLSSARRFLGICADKGIPAYLERSRSGNGGHVWIFFDSPYPAYKSRKIVMSLLVESGAVSAYDKNTAFDRLFPNQDQHSGQGFGNLIALPLNGLCLKEQNSCFLDPATAVPYPDQWLFLSQIELVGCQVLDKLYGNQRNESRKEVSPEEGVRIRLSEHIRLNREGIPPTLFSFIKNELNFLNQDFIIKKESGTKYVWYGSLFSTHSGRR